MKIAVKRQLMSALGQERTYALQWLFDFCLINQAASDFIAIF